MSLCLCVSVSLSVCLCLSSVCLCPPQLRPDLSAEAHWIWTQDPDGHDQSYCRYVSHHQTFDCPAAQARYLHDYPDVATFNIAAYQMLQPGETQEAQGDWTFFPNLGLQVRSCRQAAPMLLRSPRAVCLQLPLNTCRYR
eukprot:SAG22_NODE_3166_length_1885_cov_16.865423_2_plen_139_part_00